MSTYSPIFRGLVHKALQTKQLTPRWRVAAVAKEVEFAFGNPTSRGTPEARTLRDRINRIMWTIYLEPSEPRRKRRAWHERIKEMHAKSQACMPWITRAIEAHELMEKREERQSARYKRALRPGQLERALHGHGTR